MGPQELYFRSVFCLMPIPFFAFLSRTPNETSTAALTCPLAGGPPFRYISIPPRRRVPHPCVLLQGWEPRMPVTVGSYSHSKECSRRITTKLSAASHPTLAKKRKGGPSAERGQASARLLSKFAR